MNTRFLWCAWALVLIGGLSFHYGPGRQLQKQESAAAIVSRAASLQQIAEQKDARATQLSAARSIAQSRANETNLATDVDSAKDAFQTEHAAWKESKAAWTQVADTLNEAMALVPRANEEATWQLRFQRDRAMSCSGQYFAAADDLEEMLSEIGAAGKGESPLAQQIQAGIGATYFDGAVALRASGAEEDDWRLVSSKARQQFRLLAESTRTSEPSVFERHQRNLEVVLNLEQLSDDDLQASATPKNCKGGECKLPKRGAKKPETPSNTSRSTDRIPEIDQGW